MPLWPKRKTRPNVDEYGRSKLWTFCGQANDLEGVKRELAGGADVNQQDDAGYSPLHIAALNGNIAIIETLLRAGANPNLTDKHGNGPLWTAICSGPKDLKKDLLEILVKAGADPDQKNAVGKSPFDAAAGWDLERYCKKVE
jgi:ankyrin repeat protein